jgi:hypothetical protein
VELQPRVEPRNMGCVGTLAIDQQNIAPRLCLPPDYVKRAEPAVRLLRLALAS